MKKNDISIERESCHLNVVCHKLNSIEYSHRNDLSILRLLLSFFFFLITPVLSYHQLIGKASFRRLIWQSFLLFQHHYLWTLACFCQSSASSTLLNTYHIYLFKKKVRETERKRKKTILDIQHTHMRSRGYFEIELLPRAAK